MVFVNTPASSLLKTRVSIDFDDFPTITIGRSPENVVVIPDQEVSRKHASLSFSGSKLMLKDLGSLNGTFLYDGKEFQRVSDSVEVKPNNVLKFGTGTIVKLVSE
jgi:pSer/pThr/pTyr-binding forkhead associated (FHA) protein